MTIVELFAPRFPRIVCEPRFNAVHDQCRHVAPIDSKLDERKVWNCSFDAHNMIGKHHLDFV